MSTEDRIKVRALTNWRKSDEHALHKRGEEFYAPAEWLPCKHLEIIDGAREDSETSERDDAESA